MPTREERAAEASTHVGRMKAIFASEIRAAVEFAQIYDEGWALGIDVEPAEGQTTVKVERGSIIRALQYSQEKMCVLDCAAFTKPAGSYMSGGWGPESMLCASSNLYPILQEMKKPYYDKNKPYFRGGLCTDRAMFLGDVCFLIDGKTKHADVIVMAEPNRKRALENMRSEAECDLELANRITAALNIAAENKCKIFVASAFGCGFNGNDPEVVAGHFKQWIDAHPGVFDEVYFVVPGGPVFDAFKAAFPWQKVVEPVAEEQGEEEEKEDSMADIPAPVSDGRWVFD